MCNKQRKFLKTSKEKQLVSGFKKIIYKVTCDENVQTKQSHLESMWISSITPFRDSELYLCPTDALFATF